MKILIDILHPAHVHFFRNFIHEMEQKNNTLLITARKKDVVLSLLEEYDIPYTCISELKRGKLHLLQELLTRTKKLYTIAKRFQPDILLGVMGASTTLVGKLLGIPCIVFYNNENANLTNWYTYPLAMAVATSSSYSKKVHGNHITYPGYHELAYLHPKRYTPKKETLQKVGIPEDEKYVLIRFVSWGASHDIGEEGLQDKVRTVKELEKHARVYITSEIGVPPELANNILLITDKKDIFDVMAYAALVFGEGASMASEAAMLGVPAVYINSLQLGFLKEQERNYGLVYNFTAEGPALQKARELLQMKGLREQWQKKRQQMLQEKIDVTGWMVASIEKIVKERHR